MYPILKGELAKRGITLEKLAAHLGKTVGTVSQKLRGIYPITLREAVQIKEFLNTDLSLEQLFAQSIDIEEVG